MPSSKALEVLVPKAPLTNEEWVRLIEARQSFIKPQFASHTLPELQRLQCRRYEGSLLAELSTHETVGDNRFSTKTQGIFGLQPWQAEEKIPNSGFQWPGGGGYPNGSRRAWGLTRDNEWILITITFAGVPGYKERGAEQITQVEIVESNLSHILEVTKTPPLTIWKALHTTIQTWLQRQEQLRNQLFDLHATMVMENRILSRRLDTAE